MRRIFGGGCLFFADLFREEGGWRPRVDDMEFYTISHEDVTWLERAFPEEEVVVALKLMNGDKTPGLDGMTLAFFRHYWEHVRVEVVGMFHHFAVHGEFEKSLNATFVALLPKKGGAEDIREFRPVCLLGVAYKHLIKVLAIMLRLV